TRSTVWTQRRARPPRSASWARRRSAEPLAPPWGGSGGLGDCGHFATFNGKTNSACLLRVRWPVFLRTYNSEKEIGKGASYAQIFDGDDGDRRVGGCIGLRGRPSANDLQVCASG